MDTTNGPNDHHSGPPPTRDLPGGPHRDAEAGVAGLDVDDPSAGSGPDLRDGAAVADLRRRPDHHRRGAPGTGYPDGGDPSAPASEHAEWGDTAYGVSVE